MSIYRIYPSKDASIYSGFPDTNTGLDEILEIGAFSDETAARCLLQFSDSDIQFIKTLSSGSNFTTYLKLYLANASDLPINYVIEVNKLIQTWDMGSGKFFDSPNPQNGVTWSTASLNLPSSTGWNTSGGSFTSTPCSQSFEYNDSKDLEINITSIFNDWTSSFNNGILLKLDDSIELNGNSLDLKFFSIDTHTIYPPCLEMRWDNSSYVTGSLNSVTSSNCIVSLGNNKGEYQQDSIQRFRVNCRDKYPARTFTTSSVYLNNQYFPSSSYWALKDLDTKETIIDFDLNYTKLSCDAKGNYFDIYCNGLEPERYYSILIKTSIDNSELVFDTDYYFKVLQ